MRKLRVLEKLPRVSGMTFSQVRQQRSARAFLTEQAFLHACEVVRQSIVINAELAYLSCRIHGHASPLLKRTGRSRGLPSIMLEWGESPAEATPRNPPLAGA